VTEHPEQPTIDAADHAPITVAHVRAVDQAATCNALVPAAGAMIDLSPGGPCAIGTEEVRAIAAGLAAERAAERRAELRRREAALRRAIDACDEASGRRDELEARYRWLVEAAAWCEELDRRAPSLQAQVEEAASIYEERQAELREARLRLERVTEQRAAAAAAIEVADRELAELDAAALDETGIRRSLEEARSALAAGEVADAEARSALASLEDRRETVQAEAEAALGARARAVAALETPPVDDREVRDALVAFESSVTFGGSAGTGTALLRALAAAQAELEMALAEAPPAPPESALAAARAEVTAATSALAAIEAERAGGLRPEQRAEIEAIHDAVLEAEERASHGFGRAAARRRLEQLRAEEQAVLQRYGYESHLEFVISGGRPGGGDSRLAAEQRLNTARRRLDQLEAQAAGSSEIVRLRAEVERLRAEGAALLGVDPGDRLEELLERHPDVPTDVTAALAGALGSVGVRPVGEPIADVAQRWLDEHAALKAQRRAGRDQLVALDEDVARCTAELEALASAIGEATGRCERASAELDAARRRVALLESELAERAGEDARRLQRLAAAEQLRAQVNALEATLLRVEAEARAQVEVLSASARAAELGLDRADATVAEATRRLARLVEELPEGRAPRLEGNPIPSAEPVAAALRDEAQRLDAARAAAAVALEEATEAADAAAAEVTALREAGDGPLPVDHVEALLRCLGAQDPDATVVLYDAVLDTAGEARLDVLARVAAQCTRRRVVVLTERPDVLGWAIEAPPGVCTTIPAGVLVSSLRAEVPLRTPTRKS
jgi:DNA repair exonuclease SbcCD ATPase subunit